MSKYRMPPQESSHHARPSVMSPTHVSMGTSTPTQGPLSPRTSPMYLANARNPLRMEEMMQAMPMSSIAPGGTADTRVDSVSVSWGDDVVSGVRVEVVIVSDLSRPASVSSETWSSSRGGGVMMGSVPCSCRFPLVTRPAGRRACFPCHYPSLARVLNQSPRGQCAGRAKVRISDSRYFRRRSCPATFSVGRTSYDLQSAIVSPPTRG